MAAGVIKVIYCGLIITGANIRPPKNDSVLLSFSHAEKRQARELESFISFSCLVVAMNPDLYRAERLVESIPRFGPLPMMYRPTPDGYEIDDLYISYQMIMQRLNNPGAGERERELRERVGLRIPKVPQNDEERIDLMLDTIDRLERLRERVDLRRIGRDIVQSYEDVILIRRINITIHNIRADIAELDRRRRPSALGGKGDSDTSSPPPSPRRSRSRSRQRRRVTKKKKRKSKRR